MCISNLGKNAEKDQNIPGALSKHPKSHISNPEESRSYLRLNPSQ